MEHKIPVIAVVGPTASGKTGLAVSLAERFNGEVLSFDSMQLYKTMDVATAKPTVEEMHGIPHYMVDVVDPADTYSVARYKEDATRIIQDIHSRGKTVVMVGGTGLYLDTLMQNIEFLEGGDNGETRARLKEDLERDGVDALYDRLVAIDPETAAKLEKNNTGRVIRALEVYYLTGHTMSYQVEQSRKNPSIYEPLYIGLNARDRQVLYDRINLRVDQMVEQGLLEEAKDYLASNIGSTASQAIGIKEMIPYLTGEPDLESCKEKLKMDTRRYAKRQLTWFRRNEDVNWFYLDDYEDGNGLQQAVLDFVQTTDFGKKVTP